MKLLLTHTFKAARRLVVLMVGSTVILVGFILLFTPGPACVVIPAGIAILATEFVWARRLLQSLKRRGQSLARSAGLTKSLPEPIVADPTSDENP